MCTNCRSVYNKYIHRTIYVPCGKCAACQQHKANRRTQRIRNNLSSGQIALFVTLTYKNEHVNYVNRVQFDEKLQYVDVHRDNDVYYANNHRGGSDLFLSSKKCDSVYLDFDYHDCNTTFLHPLKHYSDRIGVSVYSDVQKFLKRLRINLERSHNGKINFSYYACSEYGGTTQRPHFHLLLFIPFYAEQTFRSAISKSWSYDDKNRIKRQVEVARNASSYVASYVNCSSNLSKVLQTSCFKQKHSYSKGFGSALYDFQLSTLLQKIRDGRLDYVVKMFKDGVSTDVNIPCPQYIVNRYFPKFKGYSRIDVNKIFDVLYNPSRLREFRKFLDYNLDDLHKISVRLDNSFKLYYSLTGKNRFDYARDFVAAWNCYNSTVMYHFYNDENVINWSEKYDNFNEFHCGSVRSLNLYDYFSSHPQESYLLDPNLYVDRLIHTNNLRNLYFLKTKQKNVTNYVMDKLSYNV